MFVYGALLDSQTITSNNFRAQWDHASPELEFRTAATLRGLLLTILLECGPAEPQKLWEKHKIA